MKRREQSQTEQLRQALAEREAQLQEAQGRLAALEGSTSLQVGRALTAAAKRPGRSLVRLPRDLYRLWRRSGSTNHADRRRVEPVRSFDADRQEARLLSGLGGGTADQLVAATVVGPAVQAAIDPYLRSVSLRPHDAQIVMDAVDVDLLLVSASAAAPGSPWAHVGDPAAVDRTRALHWVMESAASRGIPTILLDDAPASPALRRLGFDRVHKGDAGVPLHLFNPVAAELALGPEAVYVRTGADAAVPDVLLELGVGVVDVDAPGLADALRAANVAVIPENAPGEAGLHRRAWACGTRVVVHPTVPVPDGEDLTVSVPRLRALEPTPREVRTMLRQVFLDDATPVRLAALLEGLDLVAGAPGPDLPLSGRGVAVLADPAGADAADRLAEDLLSSRLRPTEVVVPDTAARLPGLQRLRSEGITIRSVHFGTPDTPAELTEEGDAAPGGLTPRQWADLADRATAPWAFLWTGSMGRHRLVDLVCAAECSGADAVGTPRAAETPAAASGVGERGFFDRDSGTGQYVYVTGIGPELARTDLLRRGWDPREWNRRGTRLLALGPDHGIGTDSGSEGSAHADASTGALG
ncbi:hypothetical protein [Nocardiopsis sp. MG754419]|uniref:hypothetical protein n=1 Tax=Nocardiopsis sp. MG754419 TaxID=2259865 RepID=UPI001BAD3284|nr:hypothetical protein [Nocardiopsis sp. MG754419]MBR8741706.1 hypothetical protein [Nocardiopsis sp. MG754419]